MSRGKDFIQGLKVLTGVKPFSRGDKNLAIAASLLKMCIGVGGLGVVRSQSVKASEKMVEAGMKNKL